MENRNVVIHCTNAADVMHLIVPTQEAGGARAERVDENEEEHWQQHESRGGEPRGRPRSHRARLGRP